MALTLFGEEIQRAPEWVYGIGALVTLGLIPIINLLTQRWLDYKKSKRLESTESEASTVAGYRALMKSINEQRGRDIARFESERTQILREWAEERKSVNEKLKQIEEENDHCRVKSAQQEEQLKYLSKETDRQSEQLRKQDEELRALKKRLGDLSNTIDRTTTNKGQSQPEQTS